MTIQLKPWLVIERLIREGKSNKEIKEAMLMNYGDEFYEDFRGYLAAKDAEKNVAAAEDIISRAMTLSSPELSVTMMKGKGVMCYTITAEGIDFATTKIGDAGVPHVRWPDLDIFIKQLYMARDRAKELVHP